MRLPRFVLSKRPQGPPLFPVEMLVSVGGDYIAGETYLLPADDADALILKGYADGALSREYGNAEVQAARSTQQVVIL